MRETTITVRMLLQCLDPGRELARSNADGNELPDRPSAARRIRRPGRQRPMRGKGNAIKVLLRLIDFPRAVDARSAPAGSISLFRAETGPLSSLLFKLRELG